MTFPRDDLPIGDQVDISEIAEIAVVDLRSYDVRLRNALSRRGIESLGDLADLTPGELSRFEGVGSRTLRLAHELVTLATPEARRVVAKARSRDKTREDDPVSDIRAPWDQPASWDQPIDPAWQPDLEAHLRAGPDPLRQVLAHLSLTRRVETLADVFRDQMGVDRVADALSALEAVRIADVAGVELAAMNPLRSVVDAIEMLSPRLAQMLEARYGAEPATLESVGADAGVTRERARQLLKRATVDIVEAFERSISGAGVGVSKSVVFDGAAAAELEAQLGGSLAQLGGLAEPVATLIVAESDEWHAVGAGVSVSRDVNDWLDGVAEHVAEGRDVAVTYLADHLELTPPEVSQFIEAAGFHTLDGLLVDERPSSIDHVVRYLRERGCPASWEAIREEVFPDRSAHSIRNLLSLRDEVVRVDKAMYGLPDWGLRTYTSVVDAMHQALSENGAPMPVAELVSTVTGWFDVSPSSVRTYAGSDAFVQMPDGRIRARLEGEPIVEDLPDLAACGGVYHADGAWWISVEVTTKLLKGFSPSVPASVAAAFGCPPMTTISRVTDHGEDVSVVRSAVQQNIGRLRAVAERLGAREGDRLLVELADQGAPVRVRHVTVDALEATAGTPGGVAVRMGLSPDASPTELGAALAVTDPTASTVVSTLRIRGEEELAAWLEVDGDPEDDIARLLGF